VTVAAVLRVLWYFAERKEQQSKLLLHGSRLPYCRSTDRNKFALLEAVHVTTPPQFLPSRSPRLTTQNEHSANTSTIHSPLSSQGREKPTPCSPPTGTPPSPWSTPAPSDGTVPGPTARPSPAPSRHAGGCSSRARAPCVRRRGRRENSRPAGTDGVASKVDIPRVAEEKVTPQGTPRGGAVAGPRRKMGREEQTFIQQDKIWGKAMSMAKDGRSIRDSSTYAYGNYVTYVFTFARRIE